MKFHQVVFYSRDKTQYDLIYQKSLLVDRDIIPIICVRTQSNEMSSVHTDNHYEDYEVTDSLVLNAKFAEIFHRRINPAEYSSASVF